MAGVSRKFHWADYLLFSLSFVLAIVIGLVVAIKSKLKKQSSESYLIANRKLNWFMVAVSILSTSMSAMSIVTLPTEYYFNGNKIMWLFASYFLGGLFAVIIAIPKYHRLGLTITSSFEYFEARYNVGVRMLFAIYLFLLSAVTTGIGLYLPSIVLAHVSVLNIYWSMTIGATVCAIYTAIGGMKAVVWVDNLQAVAMFAGLITLAVLGINGAGGWDNAWNIYETHHRNNAIDLDPSPWKRHNVWNLIFLLGFGVGGSMSFEQSLLQRYMTVPMRYAQLSVTLSMCGAGIIQVMIFFIAIAAFATLGGNDPLLSGQLTQQDEIFPFYMMETVGMYPGVAGVIVSCLYAAALSSISSGITARASTFLEDVVRPIHRFRTKSELSPRAASIISKAAGTGVGLFSIVASLMVPALPDTLFSIVLSLGSFGIGPMMGVFLTSFFFSFVESIGIVCGFFASLVWAVTLYFGAIYLGTGIGRDNLPLYLNNFTEVITRAPVLGEPVLFDISYLWYYLLDAVVVMVVASCVSLIVILVCGKGKWVYKRPAKELLYTLDDFLVGIGIRSVDIEEKVHNTSRDKDLEKLEIPQEDMTEKINGSNTNYGSDPSMNHDGNELTLRASHLGDTTKL